MEYDKLVEYARKERKTNDTQYNRGMKDTANGNHWTEDAKYYRMCNGER